MTADEIKLALLLNRQRGRRPRSQYQLAQILDLSRTTVCIAIKNPARYPKARRRIEQRLRRVVESAGGKGRKSSTAAKIAVNDPAA